MIKIYKIFFIIIYISMSGKSLATNDKDVTHNSLINAVRSNYENLNNVNFSVHKALYFKDYAYFCGVPQYDNGDYFEMNNFVTVYDMLLKRSDDDNWKEIANFNSFSSKNTKVTCHLSGELESLLSEIKKTNDICLPVDKGIPERKSILDAIREDKDQQFVVTRLCKTSSIAYFCGTSLDKNSAVINGTGNAIDVNDVILIKDNNGKWNKIVDFGIFTMKVNDIKCHFGNSSVVLPHFVLQDAAKKLKLP